MVQVSVMQGGRTVVEGWCDLPSEMVARNH